jgi:phospholipid/cholesterol/gamma-HCH transport system substrate-binding protein
MKQNMVETFLGAAVLIIAVLFFVLATGQTGSGNGANGYTITAQFTDIGSLNAGDDVKISGVKVGTVDSIALEPAFYNAVVTLAISEDVQIPFDTAARISSEGLLGGNFLALDIGGDTEMMSEGDEISITQSAQNLEQLLGQFIFSLQNDDDGE